MLKAEQEILDIIKNSKIKPEVYLKETPINEAYADANSAKELKFGEDFGEIIAILLGGLTYDEADFVHGASKEDVMKALKILKPQGIKLIYGQNDEVDPRKALKLVDKFKHIYVTGPSGACIWFGMNSPLTGFDLEANEVEQADVASLKDEIQSEISEAVDDDVKNAAESQDVQKIMDTLDDVFTEALINCSNPGEQQEAVNMLYEAICDIVQGFLDEVGEMSGDVESVTEDAEYLIQNLGKKLSKATFGA